MDANVVLVLIACNVKFRLDLLLEEIETRKLL